MGTPAEHGLRSAALAVRLGAVSGASERDCADAFYLAFLRYAGCTADSHLAAEVMGDEVAVRGELFGVDWGSTVEFLPRLARAVTSGKPAIAATAALMRSLSGMPKLLDTGRSHCEVGDRLAGRIGFDERFRKALFQSFERWDGKGWPNNAAGEAIALPMRIAQLAEDIDVGHRQGGVDTARQLTRRRARGALDPSLVEQFQRHAGDVCQPLAAPSPWAEAMKAEPGPPRTVESSQVDEILRTLGDFADLKSRYKRTHSAGVAALAGRAAQELRLASAEQRLAERAGWVHDLGVVAVSAAIWDKPTALTDLERERVRLHAYAGERILARAPALQAIAEVAMQAHERLDGSGYHRKLPAAACPPVARLLAASDVYHALTERRPQRAAHDHDLAAAELSAMARTGALCPDAVAAVLAAAGQKSAAPARPAGLTERELEVLRLVARGLTNKEVASTLQISTRTAGHHLEHVFEKIGVTTRAAATMFAMEKGLIA